MLTKRDVNGLGALRILLRSFICRVIMMRLTSSAQMHEIDKYAIEALGIAGVSLMSNASGHVASAAMERLPPGGKVAVFCGTGNNGGDGIGAAACLKSKGIDVRAFLVGEASKLTHDSKEMLKRLEVFGGSLEPLLESGELLDCLNGCAVIIDAIFGIGLNDGLRDDALVAAELINSSRDAGAFVISVDIPSGIIADSGAIPSCAVKADLTITFSLAKPGHFADPGSTHCGEIRILDIGIPYEVLDKAVSSVFAVLPDDVSLPRRSPGSHKGDYGRCFIVSGSIGYTGAPVLCARAATKMGAGLVYLGVPEQIYNIMATKLIEEMPFPLPGDRHGRLASNAAGEILRRAGESDVCLIGPGLGQSGETAELVRSAISIIKTPIVLDADGINALAGDVEHLHKAACPLVLTPHYGEFVRLVGNVPSGERLRSARTFAAQYGCYLVLKGHRTVMAMPDGTAYINTTGGPAMAKGGSGDVLAGMIAALIGQRFPIKEAVLASVYLHGLAGDLCAAEFGEYSVTASDIISMLPKAISTVHSSL